ncbi:MAG TPA: NUDIX hydrolase, partial [Burkholderiales bacterium]|nr:NUDIX hydrolase [Burkholderiales bacterium]
VGVYRWHYAAKDVTFLRFCFAGDAGEADARRKLDKEIVRLHWLTPVELEARRAEHRSPLVAKCVADFLAGRRFPLDMLSPEFA